MELFPTSKIIISFGALNITWYAFFIVSAAILCFEICAHNLKKLGYKKELAEDLFYGMLPWAIIGARLWYVVFEWQNYISNPISILYIWEGGLGIYGGVLAGIGYGYYFARKHKISFLRWADEIVPNLLLAQAIGRWGNFVNQEAFGREVSEAFYKYFPDFISERMYINGAYREPTFLYESVANLIGWLVITFLYKRKGDRKRGDLLCAYFAWYGVTRFFIEGLRTDALYIFDVIRVSQLTSVILMVVAFFGIIVGFKKFIKHKPVVLFDLDGTLIDSDELIFESFKYVFGKYEPELALTEDILKSFLGPSLVETFSKYSLKDVDMLISEYREYNDKLQKESLKPINNAKALLEKLKADGYKIGIVTTKFQETAKLGLKLCKLEDLVEVMIAGDMVEKQKPNPEAIYKACDEFNVSYDYIVMVGDSPADIMAAKNANALSIGVSWGAKGRDILDKLNPDYMVDDLLEIVEIVEEKFI